MRTLKKSFAVISNPPGADKLREKSSLPSTKRSLTRKSGIRDDNFQGFFSVLINRHATVKTQLDSQRGENSTAGKL